MKQGDTIMVDVKYEGKQWSIMSLAEPEMSSCEFCKKYSFTLMNC